MTYRQATLYGNQNTNEEGRKRQTKEARIKEEEDRNNDSLELEHWRPQMTA